MTADVAMPKSKSLADGAARYVSHGDRAASPDGYAEGAPTPFYDHLMSMIRATALENRRVPQSDDDDAALSATNHGGRIRLVITGTAGLIVAAVIGGVISGSGLSQRDSPVVAANHALEGRSLVVGSANPADAPAERPLPAAEPDGLEPIGVEGKATAGGGIEAGTVLAAKSDEGTTASPVAGQAVENLGSDVETQGDGPADGQGSTQAMDTDPIAPAASAMSEQPLPLDAPSSLPPASESASTVDRADDPAAMRIARIVSGVNMRAGPDNGQAVLTTIPRGSPVEVIDCRQWCEVIFAGQRGWVYKSFIETSPTPPGR